MPVIVSKHAFEQAKQRLGLKKKKAFSRLAQNAFANGIRHSETTGRLKKFIDKKYLTYRTANNMRIYGENLYLFSGETLITVYQVPNDLKKAVKRKNHDRVS